MGNSKHSRKRKRRENRSPSAQDEENTRAEALTQMEQVNLILQRLDAFEEKVSAFQLEMSKPWRHSSTARRVERGLYELQIQVKKFQQQIAAYIQHLSAQAEEDEEEEEESEGEGTEELVPSHESPDSPPSPQRSPSLSPQHSPVVSPRHSPVLLDPIWDSPRVLRPRKKPQSTSSPSKPQSNPSPSKPQSNPSPSKPQSNPSPSKPQSNPSPSKPQSTPSPSASHRGRPRGRRGPSKPSDIPLEVPEFSPDPEGPTPWTLPGRLRNWSSADIPLQPRGQSAAQQNTAGPSTRRNNHQPNDNGMDNGSQSTERKKKKKNKKSKKKNKKRSRKEHRTSATAAASEGPTAERSPRNISDEQPLLRALLSGPPAAERTVQPPAAASDGRRKWKTHRKPKTEWMLRTPQETDSSVIWQSTLPDMLSELQLAESQSSDAESETLENLTEQQQASGFVTERVPNSLETLAAAACALEQQLLLSEPSEMQPPSATFESLTTQQQAPTLVTQTVPNSGYSLQTLAAAACSLEPDLSLLQPAGTQPPSAAPATIELLKTPSKTSAPPTQTVLSFKHYLQGPPKAGFSLGRQIPSSTALTGPTQSQHLPSSSVQLIELDSGPVEKAPFVRAWEDPPSTAAQAESSVRAQSDSSSDQATSERPRSPIVIEVVSRMDPPWEPSMEAFRLRNEPPQEQWSSKEAQASAPQMRNEPPEDKWSWTNAREWAPYMMPEADFLTGEYASQETSHLYPPQPDVAPLNLSLRRQEFHQPPGRFSQPAQEVTAAAAGSSSLMMGISQPAQTPQLRAPVISQQMEGVSWSVADMSQLPSQHVNEVFWPSARGSSVLSNHAEVVTWPTAGPSHAPPQFIVPQTTISTSQIPSQHAEVIPWSIADNSQVPIQHRGVSWPIAGTSQATSQHMKEEYWPITGRSQSRAGTRLPPREQQPQEDGQPQQNNKKLPHHWPTEDDFPPPKLSESSDDSSNSLETHRRKQDKCSIVRQINNY